MSINLSVHFTKNSAPHVCLSSVVGVYHNVMSCQDLKLFIMQDYKERHFHILPIANK